MLGKSADAEDAEVTTPDAEADRHNVESVASTAPRLVAGIGASAGGLEVLEEFLRAMPPTSGMTLIIVQHLSPDHRSHMVELLAKHTALPVFAATHGTELRPDSVYLIPPKKVLTVRSGALYLSDRGTGLVLPIDILFRSIAEEYRERSAGIVLSGTGSDGMRGVRAIKEVGGLVCVQEPSTAKFDGMPRAAAATGVADFILPVAELPAKLVGYANHAEVLRAALPEAADLDDSAHAEALFGLVRRQTGVDFTAYKSSTVHRRIHRRMAIVGAHSFEDYVKIAQQSTAEVAALFREFLISVTRFFRDGDMFELLRRDVIPTLVEKTRPGESLRVWVPGCSTGEEAYSLGMLFEEYFEGGGRPREVKIFATDIDAAALEVASAGVYPESIAADVSPERLARFFTKQSESYQVARFLRQRVVFANHDLTRDPPFSRVSLISCRNLLIYFTTALQSRVLSSFRFALKSGGYLVLGNSETAGEATHELSPLPGAGKVYRRTEVPSTGNDFRASIQRSAVASGAATTGHDGWSTTKLGGAVETLARAFAPPTALINEQNEVLHFFGEPTPLLRLTAGSPTLNLLQLLPQPVGSVVGLAIHRAVRDSVDVDYGRIPTDWGLLRVTVRLVTGQERNRQMLVSFHLEASEAEQVRDAGSVSADAQQQISDLQQELQYSRESLQATIEELETSNEELQATNEELIASNEELQATNEELQSVNEELYTLNAEHQQKIEELVRLNDDIHNLLKSTRLGLVFLDASLNVARFTAAIGALMNLLPRDVGRPISHISLNFDPDWFYSALKKVAETQQALEREHTLADGRTYSVRVAPYVAESAITGGLVVTALDVTDTRRVEQRLAHVLDALPQQVAVLDRSGVIVAVNAEWRRFALENGASDDASTGVGANYLRVCRAGRMNSKEAQLVDEALVSLLNGQGHDFEVEYPCDSPAARRWFLMQARAIHGEGAVVSHVNITKRKVLELELASALMSGTSRAKSGASRERA